MTIPTRSASYASVIGTILSEERERKVFTQAAVAKIAGLTQSTWGRMELGRACTIENLGKAAHALKIELWELLKAVDDRVKGLEAQNIQVVFELPSEDEVKANPDVWITGSALRTLSIMGLGAASGAALAGVASYISSVFKKNSN